MKKLIYLFLIVAVASCTPAEQAKEEIHGIDVANMDPSANPKDDFYRYVNGGWLDKTEIPSDESLWGGFSQLVKVTNNEMLIILDEAVNSGEYGEGTDQRKASDFFSIGMDSLLAEKAGATPIEDLYAAVDGISSLADLQKVVAELHISGFNVFHNAGVFGDLKDSQMNSFYIVAAGLGLPNRDYYTKEDEKSVDIREKYVAHIARMLSLSSASGSTNPADYEGDANNIMAIENQLAIASLTPIESRDFSRQYNKMGIDELSALTPAISWPDYLSDIWVKDVESFIVMQPKFMKELNVVLNEQPLENLQAYMKWHIINKSAEYLNNELAQADFDFYSTELRGTTEMKPRWERVLGKTNRAMGEALGKLYVDAAFPPEAKQAALEMVDNVLLAMKNRIEGLEWMSDTTKEQALRKLAATTVKIGYPNKWKDYSGLEVEKTGETYSYLGNVLNSDRFQHKEAVEKIGKPVDKTEWGMSPQTVNAYYHPLNNEIVFPAAIMQSPFYDFKADPAVNYGGMGAVIGHEISHGFDDQGSRFNAEGNMINWWTEADQEQFDARAQVLVDQFDSYEVMDSLFVQGKLTLGENIGDIAGLSVAYDAMQIYYETHERPEPIDGFTQEQRFYLSWATVWRTKYRDEELRNRVLTDVHSPGMYRAVGPLINLPTFYAAFDIKEGDKMWKPDSLRVKIW
ncbi:MAG: M13 family peptidase [Bacteroidetes bacterium]|nr:MAG: M13 family peptidase [Bacteroidota bacterium]